MHVNAGQKNKCNTMFKTYIHDLSLFVIVYDFYPMSCMFSITKPWQGNHTHRWIKTTYHHQRFFSITPLPPFTTIFFSLLNLIFSKNITVVMSRTWNMKKMSKLNKHFIFEHLLNNLWKKIYKTAFKSLTIITLDFSTVLFCYCFNQCQSFDFKLHNV